MDLLLGVNGRLLGLLFRMAGWVGLLRESRPEKDSGPENSRSTERLPGEHQDSSSHMLTFLVSRSSSPSFVLRSMAEDAYGVTRAAPLTSERSAAYNTHKEYRP